MLAALHSVDYKAVGLGDYGPTASYVERQVSSHTRLPVISCCAVVANQRKDHSDADCGVWQVKRWTGQYEASKTSDIKEMVSLLHN